MPGPIGRPRTHASTTGEGTRRDILDAAARLFTEDGYGRTSTHKIAAAARISQPTLYHYYGGKHAILSELLLATVRPSLAFAEQQRHADAPPAVRLAALCAFDAGLLLSGAYNLGTLYLLPEIGDEEFAEFRDARTALYRIYRAHVADVLGSDPQAAHGRASLVFGLVESTILRRRTEPGLTAARVAPELADAALAILDLPGRERRTAVAAGLDVARDGGAAGAGAVVNRIDTSAD